MDAVMLLGQRKIIAREGETHRLRHARRRSLVVRYACVYSTAQPHRKALDPSVCRLPYERAVNTYTNLRIYAIQNGVQGPASDDYNLNVQSFMFIFF
jgi:hypothetical protein